MERSLVPFEGAPEGLREELEELQKAKYEAALRNLITGTTPKEVVFQRPARGGAQVDYVPGWWFVEQANSLFSYFWDHEIIDQDIGKEQVWAKSKVTIKVPGKTIIVRELDKEGKTVKEIETRFDPVEVSKTQFGGSDIKKYSTGAKTGQVIDIADDLKSAGTDGMKKCFAEFGFAGDIYGRREVLEQTSGTRKQLDALYKVGERAGMTKVQVDEFCYKKYEKDPGELESIIILGLISELRSKASETK